MGVNLSLRSSVPQVHATTPEASAPTRMRLRSTITARPMQRLIAPSVHLPARRLLDADWASGVPPDSWILVLRHLRNTQEAHIERHDPAIEQQGVIYDQKHHER
jgi:hypothetical protein